MSRQTLDYLLGGIAALMVAMGIGRFAFTPILPMMIDHHLFSAAGAGYLASSNYLGYLIGAILLTLIQVKNRSMLLFIGLIGSIATTWGMGAFHSLDVWLTLRFLSGLASAVVFIAASSLVLDRISGLQAGIFYGGVGGLPSLRVRRLLEYVKPSLILRCIDNLSTSKLIYVHGK